MSLIANRGRRPRAAARTLTCALVALLALPAAAHAHGFGESEPAGGGEVMQIIVGTAVSGALALGLLFLVVGHRRGTVPHVGRLAAYSERVSGLPGWAALPLSVAGGSLIIAVFGMYWDIATHIDAGRDAGPFANASHYFILAGLFGIFAAGILALFLPKDERPGPAAVRIQEGWYAPLGGVLILVCSVFSLAAFPMDDVWHRIFGQDVTLWGPTHLVLFGAAALSTIGALMLMVEGTRAAEAKGREPNPKLKRAAVIGLAGALLIGLSTFQGEYDYAVPQFRLIMHPVLLMLAASIALVAARIYLGRGGALAAAGFFILVRGILALLVSPIFGHTTLHFPLFLVEAIVVELVALRVSTSRPLALGAWAGVAIGTVGLAAEWAWSHIWWTIPWTSSMWPEAAIAGFVTAVAGGIIGARVGTMVEPPPPAAGRSARPLRYAVPAAALALLAVLVYSVPISQSDPDVTATVSAREVQPPRETAVELTVRLDPADAAEDAHWLNATAWQGKEGRSVVNELEEVSEGVYRTTEPIPVHGSWKTTLRLHRDDEVMGLAVYFPEDEAIPAPEVPVPDQAGEEREFVVDEELLQREQKPDVPSGLKLIAYLVVLAIGLALLACVAVALRRLESALRRDDERRAAQRRRPEEATPANA